MDGLRGIAVGLVLVHHFVRPYDFGGNIGVDVFFVLSGFLITTILLGEWSKRSTIRLRRFYIRRAIRLWPPLLLALAALAVPGLLLAPSVSAFVRESVAAGLYLTPVAQLLDGDNEGAWYHTWTLGLEEYFYLLWPAVLLLTLGRRWGWRTLAGLCAAGGMLLLLAKIGLSGVGVDSGAYLRAGALAVGAALAVVMRNRPEWVPPRWWGTGGLALIGVAVLCSTVQTLGVIASLSYLLTAIGSVAVVATVSRRGGGALLTWKPLVATGVVSYELYLWHYPVLQLAAWATDRPIIEVAWWAGPLGIALAVLAYRLLHQRTERWKVRY
ncbi:MULTISPECIES: acyltransferase family protein [unclassified Modestobacter]|uniref:acyltransferase family protein n=1 Tax=unclassified Modestobacter TaxID=2643866 RepID=UPI0022AAFBFE|nr:MULTISPECIES: acyltransferase [unclassified Modestobacter]MCZ2825566.1 acyltransferase [Modestobacter sp. VKM Ac-2981]MCZ2853369.1 acyltransferase [Modestobacter sp. VKM Ac-2982]